MTNYSWRRFLTFLLPLGLLTLLLATPVDAGGSRHPYFNDRGTLRWYHSFAEARRTAQAEQKLIFVEYGRKACSNCRKLAQSVLPHSRVRARISALAIGLAAECDAPEREVYDLFKRNLRNARTLPFVGFVTPRGRWITGWAGYADVNDVDRHLAIAEARHRSIFGRRPTFRRKARPKSPVPRPAPTPVREPVPLPVNEPVNERVNERVNEPNVADGSPDGTPEAGPARAPQPTPVPVSDVGYTDADLEADGGGEECEGGPCVGGNCAPPSFDTPTDCVGGNGRAPSFGARIVEGFRNMVGGKRCPPECPPRDRPTQKRVCPPGPDGSVARKPGTPQDCLDFPPPAPRIEQPRRHLTTAAPGPAPVPSEMPYGDPDGAETAPPRTPNQMLADTAARNGDWATVVRLTRDAHNGEVALRSLNRRAHSWAHGRLAFAVRAVRQQRYEEARSAMDEVGRTMKGEPESVDADRGLKAIELMRDMTALAGDSPLRATVRKTAYEQLRGTRWAPLFSDVPAPSPALSKK